MVDVIVTFTDGQKQRYNNFITLEVAQNWARETFPLIVTKVEQVKR